MHSRWLEQPLRGNERRGNERHGHPEHLLKNRRAYHRGRLENRLAYRRGGLITIGPELKPAGRD